MFLTDFPILIKGLVIGMSWVAEWLFGKWTEDWGNFDEFEIDSNRIVR